MAKDTKKILFRADGNSSTGLGHLYRLFALVEMLKANFETVFLTSESSTLKVIPEEYHLKTIPNSIRVQDEPKWIEGQYPPTETIVIADGYAFDSAYQKQLVTLGFKLVYIDDLVSEYMYANIVVNHAVGVHAEMYENLPSTRFALGTEFAILRPEFLASISNKRVVNKIEHVFVCFGGADALNLTEKTTRTLLEFDQVKQIHIVLGGAYQYSENSLLKQKSERVEIYNNVSAAKLVEVMQGCQLAIVPSSTILYEVCAVQIPVLSGYYVNNQENIYAGFIKEGAISGLGDFNDLTTDLLKKRISETLLRDEELNTNQINKQRILFDDLIVKRYIKLIESLC